MSSSSGAERQTTSLALNPVGCGDCVWKIENGLQDLPGVLELSSDRGKLIFEVTFDPALTNRDRIVKQVEDMGFRLKGKYYETVGILAGLRLAFSRARAQRRSPSPRKPNSRRKRRVS